MRFSTYYGLAAAAGFSPREAGDMSLWQWAAAVEGHGRAHWGLKEPVEAMSIEKLRALGIEGFEDG